jgi:predicted  nucleic acid-binding Zn-ribbon protein
MNTILIVLLVISIASNYITFYIFNKIIRFRTAKLDADHAVRYDKLWNKSLIEDKRHKQVIDKPKLDQKNECSKLQNDYAESVTKILDENFELAKKIENDRKEIKKLKENIESNNKTLSIVKDENEKSSLERDDVYFREKKAFNLQINSLKNDLDSKIALIDNYEKTIKKLKEKKIKINPNLPLLENSIENAIAYIEKLDEELGEMWSVDSEEIAKVLVDYGNNLTKPLLNK